MSKEIKAVIFDMDGVIVDSETINFHAMLKTLEQFDVSFGFDYYSQFPGGSCIEAYEKVMSDYHLNYDIMTMVAAFNENRKIIARQDGWTAVDNAIDTVKYCADKYELALASGSAIDIIMNVIQAFGIDELFKSVISGESIEHCKPAPDIFLKSAENIGISPQNCAVIEDSHNGVLAAKAAGMMCIGFINQHSGNQDLSKADYIVDNMADIRLYL